MELADSDKPVSCSICCTPLNSKTRGIIKISQGEGTKPVSDLAWSELFEGSFDDGLHDSDHLVCRQCHRLLEEYGNIEADLLDCRRRLVQRFREPRVGIKQTQVIEDNSANEENRSNSSLLVENVDFDDQVEEMLLMSPELTNGDVSPISDFDSDFDLDKPFSSSPVSRVPVKKAKKIRKPGNMHCQICKAMFPSNDKNLISEHYESHEDRFSAELANFPFICEICGQRFSTQIKLKTHSLRRHKNAASASNESRQCPACDQKFSNKRDFGRHVREHELNDQSVFRCSICDLNFVNYARLVKHCNGNHKEDHRCKYGCMETFKSRSEINEHYQHHVEERPHCCNECGSRFENPRSLKQHRRSHQEGREVIRCNLCDSSFATRAERKQHLLTHGTNCEICGKILSSVQTLVDHLRMHHQERKFSCQMCGMLFSSQNALKAHVLRHTGGPKFQCEVCGKVFNYQTNLDAHFRATHMQDATFKCPECPKNYGSLGSLRRHVNSVHQMNRKYSCNICGQSFLYSSSMLKHRRTHTGERKYPCPVCNKAFSSWDNRYSHMFIHGDKKPFECAICSQGFPRKHHILTHLKTSHPAEASSLDHTILMPAGNLHSTIKTEHGAEIILSSTGGPGTAAVEIQTSPLPDGMDGSGQQLVPMLMPSGSGEDGETAAQFLLIPVS
ncbi:unnamed protein product [Notodromas monacha]|uniref:C2H2-type domain-containing protein n=1 Tax=Notodromas monacha TaxID=399045 RepID=A0A7R9BST3_9CRUS|nr:unnamed protein product [Notodromas monacha]CAG0919701.1 unnamed protein product [Notodromas monacha]